MSTVADASAKISFFGLDTNEALTDRSLDQVDAQFALDRILSGLIDWSSCHQYCIEAGRSILSKPVATLTVLEQAYLHSEYPARLPIVPKGVESITALQGALLGSIEKAIAVSTLADLADVSGANTNAKNKPC